MLGPRGSSFLAELWDLHDKGGCGLHMFEIRTQLLSSLHLFEIRTQLFSSLHWFEIRTMVVQFTMLYMCHASSKLGVPHLQALELETNVQMMT